MALDLTGTALANLMAAAGLGPPALPSNPTTDEVNNFNTAIAAQAKAYSIILTYIHAHATISVTGNATAINDSTAHPCSGTLTSTGTLS